mmetsp:Transcript_22402/g.54738  ORF Transcript_22402/g.54738 Transcript_22402/m.54738 type:complete len:200 (+) Transcript_22402:659-1258(+)
MDPESRSRRRDARLASCPVMGSVSPGASVHMRMFALLWFTAASRRESANACLVATDWITSFGFFPSAVALVVIPVCVLCALASFRCLSDHLHDPLVLLVHSLVHRLPLLSIFSATHKPRNRGEEHKRLDCSVRCLHTISGSVEAQAAHRRAPSDAIEHGFSKARHVSKVVQKPKIPRRTALVFGRPRRELRRHRGAAPK